MSTLSYFERWSYWMLLEHGSSIQPELDSLWSQYHANHLKFTSDSLYFGCGHDAVNEKYIGWDLCDLREMPGVILWDVLMGIPRDDRSYRSIKSKLSLGMFTIPQVKFILWECARCLVEGGHLEITFRDFDLLYARRDDLKPELFVRYIYGSGLYYGSRRRSCWTTPWLDALAAKYCLEERPVLRKERGMNSTRVYRRAPGKLRKFSPEPKVKFKEDGSVLNDGGDFPSEHR